MKKLTPPKITEATRADLNTLHFSMSDKLVVRAEGRFAIVVLAIGLACVAAGWTWLL